MQVNSCFRIKQPITNLGLTCFLIICSKFHRYAGYKSQPSFHSHVIMNHIMLEYPFIMRRLVVWTKESRDNKLTKEQIIK